MTDWFVIRADANKDIGIGHVMRCLALAEWAVELNLKAYLLTKNMPTFLKEKAKSIGAVIVDLKDIQEVYEIEYEHSNWLNCAHKTDAEQTCNAINLIVSKTNTPPKFIVVDHYSLGKPWERKLKMVAPILAIDDLNDRAHDCRWLLDQTFGKSELDYRGLVSNSCEFFIGVKFALLRKEFGKQAKLITRGSVTGKLKILITLGGIDKENYTTCLLEKIKPNYASNKSEVTVVVSSANPNIALLESFIAKHQWIELVIDSNNMSGLMAENDICIGAIGSTTWERFTMKLPSILCVTAINQVQASKKLIDAGLIQVIDINKANVAQSLNSAILKLIEVDCYQMNIKKISNVTDGLGASIVLKKILEER